MQVIGSFLTVIHDSCLEKKIDKKMYTIHSFRDSYQLLSLLAEK